MRFIFQFKSMWQIIFLIFFFVSHSCVYYNTFYNAQKYFKDAEKIRLENENRSLPVNAQTAYTNVIEKCDLVLEKYPDSDYVNSALLLSGQAHYHKEEYNSAESKMKQLQKSGDSDFIQQGKFWIALIKWKNGKIQPGIDQLSKLLKEELHSITPTLIHLYLADIHIELKDIETALEHLEIASEKSVDRKEKGRINQRLSELAFNRKEYDRALNAYDQVIKFSLVKKLKQDAHLQTAKIHRLKGNYEKAVKKIKSLLVEEEFRDLFGALELELVRIYELKNENEVAAERLQSIINDYSSTEISSEAYYILGKKAIKESLNLKLAKDYFEKSNKESRKSPFIKESQEIIKQIDQYFSAKQLVFGNEDTLSNQLDSLETQEAISKNLISVNISKNDDAATNLMLMSELETFTFKTPDSAEVHLNTFIKEFSVHNLYPKAVYMLYYLYNSKGDSALIDSMGNILISQFPDTEFAEAVRKDIGIEKGKSQSEQFFSIAENLWYLDNQDNALDTLRSIVRSDTSSEFALKSGFFLGYQYDYTLINPDSALKYYSWIQTYFPDREQATLSKSRMDKIKALLAPSDSSRTAIDSIQTSAPGSLKLESVSIDSFQNIMPKISSNRNDSLNTKKPSGPDDF